MLLDMATGVVYCTHAEAARRLGMGTHSLYSRLAEGSVRLRRHTVAGLRPLFRLDEVEAEILRRAQRAARTD